MKKTLLFLIFMLPTLRADEDKFRENFADPAHRAEALATLIPGTRDAFFFTALDHQLSGRSEAFGKTITAWKAAVEVQDSVISDTGLDILESRQLLLDYENNPEASLRGLIDRLGLKFDDTRPDSAAEAAAVPTRLDPAMISGDIFEAKVREKSPRLPYTLYTGERLLAELEAVDSFDEEKVRWFLGKLTRADHPGIVPLIRKALSLEKPVAFGGIALRKKLTSGQLDELLASVPALRRSESFAHEYLEKLRPGAETDFRRDPSAHLAHLTRCRDFVMTLPPAMNSLKAHVLFHHLSLSRELGEPSKEDFLAFLALPRTRHGLLETGRIPNEPGKVRLDQAYENLTGCPPVNDDEALILALLEHWLKDTNDASGFAPFIAGEKLRGLHARARLLAGADPARWAPALPPEEYKALQDETRIDFAPGAPSLLAADERVTLTLDLKNTPELRVRIYELDLPAHLARHRTEPDVSIDLDGLVPHHERLIGFARQPVLKHREKLELSELDGAGTWLVDLVSGDVSARALIRKGTLTPYLERDADSQSIRVFNEKGAPVSNARLTLGAESFTSGNDGRIRVPNHGNQPLTRGILHAGKLAAPIELESRHDEIGLDAGFHLEREQLLADQEARLHMRVRLTNHGHELPLSRIGSPALVMSAELLGGVTTERVIDGDLELKPQMDLSFQVPADLLSLTLTLRGTVKPATGGEPLKLEKSATYSINGELTGKRVATAFFCPTAEGHRLELRGRNGEPLPSRVLTLSFVRRGYDVELPLSLRTDANGRINLGHLPDIERVIAKGTDISGTSYLPHDRKLTLSSELHLASGEEIRLPLETPADTPDPRALSLIEKVAGLDVRSHFEKMSVENGMLVIRDLPPGDYRLSQGEHVTRIIVSSGANRDGLLVSPVRILPRHMPEHPMIASAEIVGGAVKLRVEGHGPDTRIVVSGKRYHHHDWNPGDAAHPFATPISGTMQPGFHGCGYLINRRLGDEMRYILDRRAAKVFPGSMLPRPSLLLHRWSEEDLIQGILPPLEGNGGTPAPATSEDSRMRRGATPSRGTSRETTLAASCDFLAMSAVVKFGLTPDADGSLSLPLADFEGCQFLEILATTPYCDDTRILPLPASDTPTRDRRLARAIDPASHTVAHRSAAALNKDAEAVIENLLDADWRAFTTFGEAHQFLHGISGDDKLREFAFLTEWPELDEERKLDLLFRHACHELHLFLARKDADFFGKHVKPLLAEKPEPTFIDDLLLERDLSKYLRPYAWQRLNAAEKALLARALPGEQARIHRELDIRWQDEAPSPDEETRLFSHTLLGTGLDMRDSLGLAAGGEGWDGMAYIQDKLKSIVIPRIEFEDTTLEEAVDFLRLRAAELDTTELDPSRRGLSINIRRPRAVDPTDEPSIFGGGDPGLFKIPELRLRDVPLETALKYICDATRMRYKVDHHGITLVPQTETGEDLIARRFRLPPDFLQHLPGTVPLAEDDPFADIPANASAIQARMPIIEQLKRMGISFPDGSSATLSPDGVLLVTNTPSELENIELLTDVIASKEARDFGDGSMNLDPFSEEETEFDGSILPEDHHFDSFPEQTRLWRESNYYKHRGPTGENLVPLNRFWLELAAWNGEGPFISAHFNACHRSANEALLCLALLDLPFKAERPEVTTEGGTLRVKAREPMILFYKNTRRTDQLAEESPLLVRQTFHPLDEPFRRENGRQMENPVTGSFMPGAPYGASLTITNPTGIGRRIDVLAQIPAGAIPLAGKPSTLSSTHELPPHGVVTLDQAFYFPAAGDFTVYPMHVSEEGTVLAHAAERTLRVEDKPAPQDAASWLVIARDGTEEDVLNRLRVENPALLNLSAIRWRLKDRAFFKEVRKVLRERLHFSTPVMSYAFLHNDSEALGEYLENSAVIRQVGSWLDSPLLNVRPAEHLDWETLDFDPLVNARSHSFAGKPRLTHEAALSHYRAFLNQLAWKPRLDARDELTWTAFLFLQDRIEEALARFEKIDPSKLPGRIQYDYLHAIALFHQANPAEAQTIAEARLETLPSGIWRDRFSTVVSQAREIAALAEPVEADEKAPATTETPSLEIAATPDGHLLLTHRAMKQATLRLFHVDPEVLFSQNPFLHHESAAIAAPAIRPNETREVALEGETGETIVELPETFRKGNVLVAAEAGDRRFLKIPGSPAFSLRHHPQDRTVQVLDNKGRPIPTAYVKVYAESLQGSVDFHKDGHTDLRGKFDVLSHTGIDASRVKRLAILVSHPELGARTLIIDR